MKIVILLILMVVPLWAEDWTTTDGKSYQDVKVIKVETDAVTILDKDGGGRVELSKLSPDLQKRFNYNPVTAKAAADARAADEANSAQALEEEREQASAAKQAELVAEESQRQQALSAYAATHLDTYHTSMGAHKNYPSTYGGGSSSTASDSAYTVPRAVPRPSPTAEDLSNQKAMEQADLVKKDDVAHGYSHANSRVTQVLPDGFIGITFTRWGVYEPAFVKCDSSGMVDGQQWKGIVIPQGPYHYTSTLGAMTTIPAFTTDLKQTPSKVAQSNVSPIPPAPRPVSSLTSVGGG